MYLSKKKYTGMEKKFKLYFTVLESFKSSLQTLNLVINCAVLIWVSFAWMLAGNYLRLSYVVHIIPI